MATQNKQATDSGSSGSDGAARSSDAQANRRREEPPPETLRSEVAGIQLSPVGIISRFRTQIKPTNETRK